MVYGRQAHAHPYGEALAARPSSPADLLHGHSLITEIWQGDINTVFIARDARAARSQERQRDSYDFVLFASARKAWSLIVSRLWC